MKKSKENIFSSKFRILNSQGSADEIHWSSSSESSEYENAESIFCKEQSNFATIKRCTKRKRKQALKNVSNLEVTVVDTRLNCNKTKIQNQGESCSYIVNRTSPILGKYRQLTAQHCKRIQNSPIISSKVFERRHSKSPILVLKSSPKQSDPKIRKTLFKIDSDVFISKSQDNPETNNSRSKSTKICLDRRKHMDLSFPSIKENNPIVSFNNESKSINLDKTKHLGVENINCTIQETPEYENFDESIIKLKTANKELSSKVKSYFESHFSSENSSQITISDVPTPKNDSKSSDDIDISNTVTQVALKSVESEQSVTLYKDIQANKKEKKIRYKKDGLAYRLNLLLKKQNASVSLWHHEKFLANNSNFIIPKGESQTFRICKTQFKYGVYSLEVMNTKDEHFLIVINKMYVTNDNVFYSSIIKLYEPYTVLDFRDDCKLIINVHKFECVNI